MKLSIVCLILSLITLMGCSTTKDVPLVEPVVSNLPIPIREASWACENSDMVEYTTAGPDYNITVKCAD